MSKAAVNKHANRSAQTRSLFIEAAQQLFAERSIDAVSLNEITVAAGQKNRNALQYHFGNRDGLLQAIIDTHAERVQQLRSETMESLERSDYSAARAAAQALVRPLADYVEENPAGIYYVKILSQLAALNSSILNPGTRSSLTFHDDRKLAALFADAVSQLKPTEAQHRMFLTLSVTFHSIADVCRASESSDTSPSLKRRGALFEQVSVAVESLLAAPPLEDNR